MYSQTLTLERKTKGSNIFELLREQDQSLLPVKLTTLPKKRFTPPRIQNIELADGRSVLFNGKKMEVPYGVKKRVSGKAIKVLVACYIGSIVAVRKGNGSWVRVRDNDMIDLPKNSRTEVKVLPSFRTE
jgi:hypothetical protein